MSTTDGSTFGAEVSRRAFMRDAAFVVGSIAATTVAGSTAAAQTTPMPKAVLGRTGVEVSRLGIGTAPFQRANVTIDSIRETLFRALDLGVNYIDTAPNYRTGDSISEEMMGPVIKEIRDKVFLVTKTEEATYEGAWKDLRESMRRMQTDHLDVVHLHNFGSEQRFGDLDMAFGDKGVLGALREAKKQGAIRFIGATGHLYPSRFAKVMDTGEIDVLMNAVNFIVRHNYNFEEKVWVRAHKENIGLVAMKVLGGAKGASGHHMPAEHYESAFRYALGLPGCSCAVIGLENVSELERAAKTVAAAQPLSETEFTKLASVGLELSKTDPWPQVYGLPLT